MSEESAKAFHKLVSAMRTSQKEFWRTRNKYALKQSIELEKQVDETIMEASASDVPDNENGKFFLEVAQLRTTTKLYFAEKKKCDADKEKINAWFKSIKEGETKVDKMLVKWFDELAIKEGKRIVWHVMERFPNAKEARSIFDNTDEQMARIELNDHLRKPACPGTMYFIAKEYKEVKK
jgi:hypothetical protein